jgi:hypothetical protein
LPLLLGDGNQRGSSFGHMAYCAINKRGTIRLAADVVGGPSALASVKPEAGYDLASTPRY